MDTDLDEALEQLDSLTDSTFLLIHALDKGFRTDDLKALVRLHLQDAVALLRSHNATAIAADGCEQCGSRDPESSVWHANHCETS